MTGAASTRGLASPVGSAGGAPTIQQIKASRMSASTARASVALLGESSCDLRAGVLASARLWDR